MTNECLEILQQNEGKIVSITFDDGEVIIAKVIDVSQEDRDVIYRLISTDRPDKYEKSDVQPTFSVPFENIAGAEPVSE